MTSDADQLLQTRFTHTAPGPDPPDWADVVRRARQLAEPSRADARRRASLIAAVLLAALAVAGSAIAISGGSTGIGAIDELLDRASRPSEEAAPNAPRNDVRPVPGSISEPLTLEHDGADYIAVGFRSRQGLICSALVDSPATLDRLYGGVGCLAERGLRQALDESPVHVFAGGGGEPRSVQGFARADVVSISPADGDGSSTVGLSEPWKPEPWAGEPIRFVYTLTTQRAGSDPAGVPPWRGLRLEAQLANGESVEIAP